MFSGQLFYEWLLTQIQRTDPIHDLASIAFNNSDAKLVRNYSGDWSRYLKRKSVSPAIKIVLKQAWTEYRQAQHKHLGKAIN